MTDSGAVRLAVAIIKCAATDYREGRQALRRKDLIEKERLYYIRLTGSAEAFLKSQWFYFLGGEEWMWKQIKRECDRGFFRKGTWDESYTD